MYFRSHLDNISDEDTDELNLSEDLSSYSKNTFSDSNSSFGHRFPEPFKINDQ